MGIPNSLKILYETSLQSETYSVLKSIYRQCTAPLYAHILLIILWHTEYMIACWSVMSKSTLMILSNFVYVWSYSSTIMLDKILYVAGNSACHNNVL
jgi:hypothetical protein